jgi:hypothetical protein
MNRRRFITQSSAGAAAAVAALTGGELAQSTQVVSAQTQGRKRALMRAGATVRCTDDCMRRLMN